MREAHDHFHKRRGALPRNRDPPAGNVDRPAPLSRCKTSSRRRGWRPAGLRSLSATDNRQNTAWKGRWSFLVTFTATPWPRSYPARHVFAIASYIENSPNSLCEAMTVGLPCVATYTGGIPSLVADGQTGLLFPPGDAPLLADHIMRIFRDDNFASRLSRAARAEASHRHAPERVICQLLTAYKDVLSNTARRRQARRFKVLELCSRFWL